MADMRNYCHTVQYYETDKMGITHHSNYIRFMEEARVQYLASIGVPFDEFERQGFASPTTSVECVYKSTTTFADRILIDVRIESFNGIKIRLSYTMTKEDGTVVALAHSEHCFLSSEGSLVRLNRANPEVYERFMKALEDQEESV